MDSKEPTGGDGAANHSSFVEHLRLIHFTLCLTCLIAIIAVSAKTSSSAQRAYNQSNFLLKIQEKWNGRRWFDSVALARNSKDLSFEVKVDIKEKLAVTIQFRPPSDQFEIGRRYPWLIFAKMSKGRLTSANDEVGERFANIEDARTIWNELKGIQYIVTPSQVHGGWIVDAKETATGNSVFDVKLNSGAPVAISTLPSSSNGKAVNFTDLRLKSDAENYYAAFAEDRTLGKAARVALELLKKHNDTCFFVTLLKVTWTPSPVEGWLTLPADCKLEEVDLPKLLGSTSAY